MYKRFQGLIVGVLIGSLLTSGIVFGKEISEMAELYYNNIKIYIDGAEIVPKDANGNTVEPFTMNGTTYLPVRAISNAFGKDVEWDGATQSVYIGKKDQTKPDNYLDRIQYNDFKKGSENHEMNIIHGSITDYNNKDYTNGILFKVIQPNHHKLDDSDKANIIIGYPLNSSYKTLKGNIVLPKKYEISTGKYDYCSSEPVSVWFYGDGKLLNSFTEITMSMPFSFDINLSGVNQLTIKIKGQGYGSDSYFALTDLALYK